jgi:hypothetical protein
VVCGVWQVTKWGVCLYCRVDSGFCRRTVMRCLTTGIRSEKCVVRRFGRCANAIECTYTNLDNIVYYTLRLYGIAHCSNATNMCSMLLY